MKTKGRLWISVVLGLLAIIILLLFVPRQVYRAAGVLLPAKQTQTQPAISPSAVVRMENSPVTSSLLGYINIERKYPAKGQLAQEQIWALAQKLAAQVGANAVVIKLFQVGGLTKGYYIYVFRGEAIYVPDVQSALSGVSYNSPVGMEF